MRLAVFISLIALLLPALAGELPLRVETTGQNAYSFPSPVLDRMERRAFSVGNSFFKDNWVPAPASTTGRDGLGPRFNARSCSACHLRDGRAAPPLGSFAGQPGLIFALPDGHARWGDQLQDRAIPGFEPEATVTITTEAVPGAFTDGERYDLERFLYTLPAGTTAKLSPRVAPAVIGMGLLESIPESMLREWADPDDRDDDGISGRLNIVDGKPGRFGWKAEAPTVEVQTAKAFHQDMGLTTSLFPNEASTNAVAVSGGSPEVDDHKLQRVVFYTRHLAVPQGQPSTDASERGRELFNQIGCASCHKPSVQLDGDAIHVGYAHRRIEPYTDLLIHDMGKELADGTGSAEWRTPPLWGLGRLQEVSGHTRLLHDGRARDTTEAILWHGGEGAASRDAFKALSKRERADLEAFLQTL